MTTLTNKQKRFLKSKAHPLKAVVMIAGNGLSENVSAAIEEALERHELIKIKIKADSREEKQSLVETICTQTKASQIQLIGHVLTIYREAKEPKLVVPKK